MFCVCCIDIIITKDKIMFLGCKKNVCLITYFLFNSLFVMYIWTMEGPYNKVGDKVVSETNKRIPHFADEEADINFIERIKSQYANNAPIESNYKEKKEYVKQLKKHNSEYPIITTRFNAPSNSFDVEIVTGPGAGNTTPVKQMSLKNALFFSKRLHMQQAIVFTQEGIYEIIRRQK